MSNEELILKLRNGMICQSITMRQLRSRLMAARIAAVMFGALGLLELVIIGMGAVS